MIQMQFAFSALKNYVILSSTRNYFEHFLKAFNHEEEIIVKPEQVRRVLCVMDAVRESARTGKAIMFEEQ